MIEQLEREYQAKRRIMKLAESFAERSGEKINITDYPEKIFNEFLKRFNYNKEIAENSLLGCSDWVIELEITRLSSGDFVKSKNAQDILKAAGLNRKQRRKVK